MDLPADNRADDLVLGAGVRASVVAVLWPVAARAAFAGGTPSAPPQAVGERFAPPPSTEVAEIGLCVGKSMLNSVSSPDYKYMTGKSGRGPRPSRRCPARAGLPPPW